MSCVDTGIFVSAPWRLCLLQSTCPPWLSGQWRGEQKASPGGVLSRVGTAFGFRRAMLALRSGPSQAKTVSLTQNAVTVLHRTA